MPRPLSVACLLTLTLLTRPAAAEQCEPREAVSFDLPTNGATVPPNVRFRVYVYKGCSTIPPGPPSQFRLVNAAGTPTPLRRVEWAGYREFAPLRPLAAGRYTFQHRHAAHKAGYTLWKSKTQVRVNGAVDLLPPRLGGRLNMTARPIWGSIYWSPCEARPGWELSIKARFTRARDASVGASSHDDLIYYLKRKPLQGGAWTIHRTFRPHTQGYSASHDWKQEHEWGQRFQYQLGVRDRAGNSVLQSRTFTLELPQRPLKRWWRGGRS
jgi:hypothetical protein